MIKIPHSPEAITSLWLTTALRSTKTIDKSEVTSFRTERIGEKEGFTGYLARFELQYSSLEETAPPSLVGKFSPNDPELLKSLKENYVREVKFYDEIAARERLPVPHCYYRDIDLETGTSIMLLEDLSHLRTVDFISGCTLEEAELVVQGLGRIHASWWENPKLQDMDWFFSFADAPYQEWWAQYPQKIQALLPDFPIPGNFFEFGKQFGSNMVEIVNQLEGPPLTCVHRDIHVDNLLFGVKDSDPPVEIVDWQLVGRGKGVSDIAYFLISSVPPALRRESEMKLLEIYHRLLIQSGITEYSFDQCWHDYLLSAVGKLFITVAATVLIDNSSAHRKAWRRADLQRLVAFIEDHKVEQFV
jgi:hypothetical protein